MTATAGWLLLAAAVLAWAAPSAVTLRVDRLAGVARLAVPSPPGRTLRERVRLARVAPGLIAVLLAGPAVVVAAIAGLAAAVAAAAVAGCGWRLARDVALGRESRGRAADLLAAVQVIVAELEAGAGPSAALLAAADVAPRHAVSFRAAGERAAEGGDAAEVLLTDPATATLGVAWRVGHDGGTALAGVLRRVVDDLRAAAGQQRTVRVALSGPRSSAVLLTGLPLLGIGLGVAMGARPFEFLLGSGPGRLVGCVGVLLDVTGVLWMRRILRKASEP